MSLFVFGVKVQLLTHFSIYRRIKLKFGGGGGGGGRGERVSQFRDTDFIFHINFATENEFNKK